MLPDKCLLSSGSLMLSVHMFDQTALILYELSSYLLVFCQDKRISQSYSCLLKGDLNNFGAY